MREPGLADVGGMRIRPAQGTRPVGPWIAGGIAVIPASLWGGPAGRRFFPVGGKSIRELPENPALANADLALGASPRGRKLLEGRSGGNVLRRVALGRVIDVGAFKALVADHGEFLTGLGRISDEGNPGAARPYHRGRIAGGPAPCGTG